MSISDSVFHESKYQKRLEEYGESPKSLLWKNYNSAAMRYKELVKDLPVESMSILDIGCGMGDLFPYLLAKTSNFAYLGVDLNPDFIEIARKRYDGQNFRVANPFSDDFEEKSDIVVACGVLNASAPNWLEERKKMIYKLFGLCNKVLAFNMAGSFVEHESTALIAYADARDILDFCLTLSPKIILRTHYHPKDFTVVMFK